MVTMTLAVPEEMKKRLDSFPELNWSAVARTAFEQKLNDLDFLQRFKEKSTLTEADALRLGKEVSRAVSARLRERAK